MEYSATENMILNSLRDDHSRELFDARLRHYRKKTDRSACASDIVGVIRKYIPRESHDIDDLIGDYRLGKVKNVLCYGAGEGGYAALAYLKACGVPVSVFADKFPAKCKNRFFPVEVISPGEVKEYAASSVVLVSVILTRYRDEIESYLKTCGFSERQIYHMDNWGRNQYFDDGILIPLESEIFVDCGAYIGDTFENFIRFPGGKYKKYHAFEADPYLVAKAIKVAEGYKSVFIHNAAVNDKRGTIAFDDCSSEGQGHVAWDGGGREVQALTIDDECPDATFIKMDIEGSELAALHGAEKTIEVNKPRLAICVYHRPEDIVEIPAYLLSLVPEYRFFIRHYSMMCEETVLYAIL
jgi:FkbM family methyltransferase